MDIVNRDNDDDDEDDTFCISQFAFDTIHMLMMSNSPAGLRHISSPVKI